MTIISTNALEILVIGMSDEKDQLQHLRSFHRELVLFLWLLLVMDIKIMVK